MDQKSDKFKIIFVGAAFSLLIIVAIILSEYQAEKSSIRYLPSPTPAIPMITKNQLINMMPIQTPYFDIEYFFEKDLFLVTVKQSPYEENKKKAEEWFRSQGFEPSTLNIGFSSYRYVQ